MKDSDRILAGTLVIILALFAFANVCRYGHDDGSRYERSHEVYHNNYYEQELLRENIDELEDMVQQWQHVVLILLKKRAVH